MKNSFTVIVSALLCVVTLNTAQAAGDAAAGQAKSALCASCHGPDGNSPLAINPKIAGQNAKYIVKQLQDFKSGSRSGPTMSAMVAALSEQDMEDIAAYYASQSVSLGGADPAAIEIAEPIYRAGIKDLTVAACSACHSPTGDGNAQAGFPSLSGQHQEYTLQQLKDFRSGARANDASGMMQTIVERMTDKELEAIASYVSGLN